MKIDVLEQGHSCIQFTVVYQQLARLRIKYILKIKIKLFIRPNVHMRFISYLQILIIYVVAFSKKSWFCCHIWWTAFKIHLIIIVDDTTGENFKNYKSWDKSESLLVIVLSCPLIGSLSRSTANQEAAQNNYYTEPDFGFCDLYFLNFFTCNYRIVASSNARY